MEINALPLNAAPDNTLAIELSSGERTPLSALPVSGPTQTAITAAQTAAAADATTKANAAQAAATAAAATDATTKANAAQAASQPLNANLSALSAGNLAALSAVGIQTQYLPSVVSGLVAGWDYRASTLVGGKISVLQDISGNGNNLTCANDTYRHTFNANGAIPSRVGGGGSANGYLLTTPLALDRRSLTIIVVAANIGTDIISSGPQQLLGNNQSFGQVNVYSANSRWILPSGGSQALGPYDCNPDEPTATAFAFETFNIRIHHRGRIVNAGNLGLAGTDTIAGLFSDSSSSAILGNNPWSSSWRTILIYNRTLSISEVESVIEDLRIKAPRPITLATVGDSISVGTGAGSLAAYFGARVAVNRGYNLFPVGQPTQTSVQAVSNGSTVTTAGSTATGSINLIRVAYGSNDLAYATGQLGNLQSNIAIICGWFRTYLRSSVTAPGTRPLRHKILVATLLPRTGGFAGGQTAGGFETDRLAYNSWLRANYHKFADAMDDVGGTSTIGAVANIATYFGDGIHPNDAGQVQIGNSLHETIDRLDIDSPLTDFSPFVTRMPFGSTAWAQAVAGSGSTTRNEQVITVNTGSTSGSTALARSQGPGSVFAYAGDSGSNSNGPDWSRRVRIFGLIGGLGGNSGGADMVARISLGKDAAAGIGNLSGRRGVQIRLQNTGSSGQVFLGANDGTTFTESATPFSVNLSSWAPRPFVIESDGAGNVRMWWGAAALALGAPTLSISGGPTSLDAGYSVAQVEVGNGATAASHRLDLAQLNIEQF